MKSVLIHVVVIGTALVLGASSAAAWTDVKLPAGVEIMAFDGERVYVRSESGTQQTLHRLNLTSGQMSVVFKPSKRRTSIPLVAARDGDVAFVLETFPGDPEAVNRSTLYVIRAGDTARRVIQRASRRDSGAGRNNQTCGEEFASVELLAGSRIQSMVTIVGRTRGSGCKVQNRWRAVRDQRQRITWFSANGKAASTRQVKIGENIEQQGGVFDFSPDGERFVFPKRTHFVGIRMSDLKRRAVRVPNARRIVDVIATDRGGAFVDVILDKRIDGHLRQLRFYPRYLTSNSSVVMTNLWRNGADPAQCEDGLLVNESPSDDLLRFDASGNTFTVLKSTGTLASADFHCAYGRILQVTEDQTNWMPFAIHAASSTLG